MDDGALEDSIRLVSSAPKSQVVGAQHIVYLLFYRRLEDLPS
jgi:hypothetical protein